MSKDPSFPVVSPDLQVRFWNRLQVLRREYLAETLSQTVRRLEMDRLNSELRECVGNERLAALAACGLRGETWYAVPYLLEEAPILLGYYRLLYGISQKEFYSTKRFGVFHSMEAANRLSSKCRALLPPLARSLAETGWLLFQGVEPVTADSIHELQLLTIGPQLRGSENNLIGQGATKLVFEHIRSLVEESIESSTEQVITVKNAAGRTVRIVFGSDPDIAVIESLPSAPLTTVSIEIKGGADVSNVHNRVGEAEKSHQKARVTGCTRFWTVHKAPISSAAARLESPTTTDFFQLDPVLDPQHPEYNRFRDLLHQVVGISGG